MLLTIVKYSMNLTSDHHETVFINTKDTPENLVNDTPKKTKKPYGLTGIINTSNTCYMNSAIQALSHNYPLTSYLFGKKAEVLNTLKKNAGKILKDSQSFKLDCTYSIVPMELRQKIQDPNYSPQMLTDEDLNIVFNHTITAQLIKLLEHMWSKNSSVIPTSFRRVFSEARDKFFFGNEQHDAEEAYSCILQKMQEELAEEKNVKFKTTKQSVQDFIQFKTLINEKIKATTNLDEKKNLLDIYHQKKREMPIESLTTEAFREMRKYYGTSYSRVTEIFSGFLHSCMRCPNEQCGFSSNKFDPFLHLSLEMPNKILMPGQNIMIDECIKDFCKEEALDEKNLWHCEGCGNKVRGVKSLRLWTAPPVLVIQFKRFKQYGSGRVVKDSRLVKYPLEHFDISSMISPCQLDTSKCNTYRLQCVVNHTGVRDGGHYYTYCLEEDTNQWYEFNDIDVARLGDINKIVTNNAYLLFYTREDMITKANY